MVFPLAKSMTFNLPASTVRLSRQHPAAARMCPSVCMYETGNLQLISCVQRPVSMSHFLTVPSSEPLTRNPFTRVAVFLPPLFFVDVLAWLLRATELNAGHESAVRDETLFAFSGGEVGQRQRVVLRTADDAVLVDELEASDPTAVSGQ